MNPLFVHTPGISGRFTICPSRFTSDRTCPLLVAIPRTRTPVTSTRPICIIMSSQPQVRVYGEDWCGDCRRTNAFLKKKNVNYVYVQFTDHPEARAVCQQITKAQKFRIPVVVFPDNSFMTEPSDGELEAKLRGLKIL